MVEYITYKKEKWPIRISYFVMKRMQSDTGQTLESAKGDVTAYEKILLYALQAGCIAEDKPCPFKEEDMEMVLDECFYEFMTAFPKFFPTDSEVGKLLGEATAPTMTQEPGESAMRRKK